MYSGTTFHRVSGQVMGVHQRIDRIARRSLAPYLKKQHDFPMIREILHFEGNNGPDGIKRKSPGKDEPWHYLDPKDMQGAELFTIIADHSHNLSTALKEKNRERAAFEAAWLAHAVIDGLTPAHHYPLEEKLTRLRGGAGLETRNSTKEKLVLPGGTRREKFRNNWEYWGAKGIMTTHLGFELGIMTTLASYKVEEYTPTQKELAMLKKTGFLKLYKVAIRQVDALHMYEEYSQKGWNRHLASETRQALLPKIIAMTMLAWYEAAERAKTI